MIALVLSALFAAPLAAEKPNVVFILVDDMGWSDLGCYGSEIQTPHIDRLAEEGLRFTQAYNTSKCFPSRACLLSGVYAQQCGMSKGYGAIQGAVTLGEVLRTAGYRTLASGKHHGTENLYQRGFDHYYGLRDGCCNFWNPGQQRKGEPEPARKTMRHWCDDATTHHPYTPEARDFYTTDAFTDKALEWLGEAETKSRPFFLYLAYTAPHYPLHAWPEDIARYEGVYEAGYEAIQKSRYRRQVAMGLIDPQITPLPESPKPSPWERLSGEALAKEVRRMQIYAAMLDRVDQNIGRLLEKLRGQGRLDDTLIFFASDNGACAEGARAKAASSKLEDFGTVASYETVGQSWATVQNTPLRYWKNYSHEGGICTPLIVSWPGRVDKPGRFERQPVHFIDVMATLVDLTGATYPKSRNDSPVTPMQGTSLLPALRGEPIQREQPLFWQWSRGGAIRQGAMKAVFQNNGRWELYNIDTDRNENHDLAASAPELLEAMTRKWDAWFETTGPK